jgi:LemA protein
MKVGLIALGVIAALIFMVGGQVVGARNTMVTEKEGIAAAFAQVDVVMQRRADLIPNLVSTAKGFATQEKEVFGAIANARAAMSGARTPAEKIQANDQLGGALSRLLMVQENYPELKSNAQFKQVMDELAGAENRISIERQKYNKAVQSYNTNIALFPNNIAASIFGFTREEAYFKTDPAARQAPKVDFSNK